MYIVCLQTHCAAGWLFDLCFVWLNRLQQPSTTNRAWSVFDVSNWSIWEKLKLITQQTVTTNSKTKEEKSNRNVHNYYCYRLLLFRAKHVSNFHSPVDSSDNDKGLKWRTRHTNTNMHAIDSGNFHSQSTVYNFFLTIKQFVWGTCLVITGCTFRY